MAKTLIEQVEELENKCKKLETYEKILDKLVREEFGFSCSELHVKLKEKETKTGQPTTFNHAQQG